MRIYFANDGETLWNLTNLLNVTLEDLVSLNPHVENPYANISGRSINLPPYSMSTEYRDHVSSSASQTNFRNEWIPLTSLEKMVQTEYDVLIVGSGAGGRLCSLAIRPRVGK